jgi:hypothetical protein
MESICLLFFPIQQFSLIGHPGRIRGLQKFMGYIKNDNRAWIARRIDLALFWYHFQQYEGESSLLPQCMTERLYELISEKKVPIKDALDIIKSEGNKNRKGPALLWPLFS